MIGQAVCSQTAEDSLEARLGQYVETPSGYISINVMSHYSSAGYGANDENYPYNWEFEVESSVICHLSIKGI